MSVRFRKDREKWQAEITVRGKRLRPLFNTKREAEDAVRRAKLKRFEIDDVAIERTLINEGLLHYFNEVSYSKSLKSKVNERLYFSLAGYYLGKERNLEWLDEITLQDLEALQKWLKPARKLTIEVDFDATEKRQIQKDVWSSSTINRAFRTYTHVFNKMCAWGRLEKNPTQYVQSLAQRPVKRATITREIYEAILAHKSTKSWFKDVLEMIWLLGCRGSSIERLTWERINFKERYLELDTKKGARAETKLITIPMVDPVFALLMRIRNKRSEAFEPKGSVFRYDNGQPVKADVISRAGTRALRACGFKDVNLYGARHGLASDLINAGVPIEVVRQLLGHSSTQTTQIYTKGTSIQTLANALKLVRGESTAPNGTKPETEAAVASGDLE
jgi:integrase